MKRNHPFFILALKYKDLNILNKYMKTNHNDINSEELKNMLILIFFGINIIA